MGIYISQLTQQYLFLHVVDKFILGQQNWYDYLVKIGISLHTHYCPFDLVYQDPIFYISIGIQINYSLPMSTYLIRSSLVQPVDNFTFLIQPSFAT